MESKRSSDGDSVLMTPSTTVMLSQDPSTRLALEKAETERRLQEAELKLANAIAEIQRQKHRSQSEEDGHVACGSIFTGEFRTTVENAGVSKQTCRSFKCQNSTCSPSY
jgi:hypothetical protein